MTGDIIDLNDQSFDKEVLKKKGFVFVDFWAPWCGPCRMMSSVFADLALEINNVSFAKVDVDKNQSLSNLYGISSIPYFILFKNGKAVSSYVGGCSKDFLKDWLDKCMKQNAE